MFFGLCKDYVYSKCVFPSLDQTHLDISVSNFWAFIDLSHENQAIYNNLVLKFEHSGITYSGRDFFFFIVMKVHKVYMSEISFWIIYHTEIRFESLPYAQTSLGLVRNGYIIVTVVAIKHEPAWSEIRTQNPSGGK